MYPSYGLLCTLVICLFNYLVYKIITNLLTCYHCMDENIVICQTKQWQVFLFSIPCPFQLFMFLSKYYQSFLPIDLQFRWISKGTVCSLLDETKWLLVAVNLIYYIACSIGCKLWINRNVFLMNKKH